MDVNIKAFATSTFSEILMQSVVFPWKPIREQKCNFLKWVYLLHLCQMPLLLLLSHISEIFACVRNSLLHLTIQMNCFLLHGSTKVAVFFGQLRKNVRRRLPYFFRMDANLDPWIRSKAFPFFPIRYPIHFASKFSDGRGECVSYAIPWCVVKFVTERCMTFADGRLQTGLTRKILLTVTSSSTTFPAQNNINLVAKILLDFLWWFTIMVLDSRWDLLFLDYCCKCFMKFLPYSKGIKYPWSELFLT